jgi:hypothetical protein
VEFLLVGDSKLKIIMTECEVHDFGLEGEYSSPGCRRAFWRVLALAEEEVGFRTDGDKLLIQFYPLKAGGCEVFVTKLGLLSKDSARMVTDSERVTTLAHKRSYYAFDSLDGARALARSLKEPYPRADLYLTDGAVCYLAVEEYTKGGESVEFPVILEFSRPLTADLEYYITEHLSPVCQGDGIEYLLSDA